MGKSNSVKSKYYDGTKLLSMKDINGNTPEIYIVTSNRSAGKTTYFGRMFINRFKKDKSKFCLIYRFSYELDECANKFFKDIGGLFFPNDTMTSKKFGKGMFHMLFLNDEHCGYAIALNLADQIKKMSHLFSDVDRMLFDEFQSETNHYCSNEVKKLQSIHTSIARGNNKQVRYVPVYMVSNPVSIINPYYSEMGISSRLSSNTKFLRGDGWVLEQGYNESASEAQKESAFNRAFSGSAYNAYSAENVYLNDNQAFIEKPSGGGRYVCTIRYMNNDYGVRTYKNSGIIYCDDKADNTFPVKIAVTTDDHNINYIMLKENDIIVKTFKLYFERGCFRFKNLKCKEAILAMVSYI